MNSFEETGLGTEVLKAVEELGFEFPTPIQQKTIPHLLTSKADLIAFAQTGTGKTAAFGLPIIQQVDYNSTQTQSIILCPTRELCLQINNDLVKFSKFLPKLMVTAVYGGEPIDRQIRALKKGSQIVVGTPGRVIDLIKRRILNLSEVKWLVLDEADEMLNMGFKEDLDTILAETPQDKQTLLFSATMPKEIANIARKYMHDPVEISMGKKNTGADNVKHLYYVVHAKDKYQVLKRIADVNPDIYGIVFCRTRMETKEIADKLIQDGYNADSLHGDLSQAQRDQVMGRFRSKNLQLLVATDVAARGIDVTELTHIINYNLPDDPEVYVHRSGRTGRAGKSGISLSIVNMKEIGKMRNIERIVDKKFEKTLVPTGKEICEKQLFKLIGKIENITLNIELEPFMDVIYKRLENISREELINRFVSVEFNQFLDYYKNATDLNVDASKGDRYQREDSGRSDRRGERSERGERSDRGERGESDRRGSDRNRGKAFSRFYFNVGSKDGVGPVNLIGIVNDNLRPNKAEIGKIEIMRNFSFVEIESKFEKDVLSNFNTADYNGEKLVVELSSSKLEGGGGEGFAPREREKPYRGGGGGDFGNKRKEFKRKR